jgi:hypothetical protein
MAAPHLGQAEWDIVAEDKVVELKVVAVVWRNMKDGKSLDRKQETRTRKWEMVSRYRASASG